MLGTAQMRLCPPSDFNFQTALFADTASRSHGACARVLPGTSCPLESEGAGNAGRPLRPQPRVQNKKHTSVVTTVTPGSPGIPRAMVLTVSFVLSPVIGLVCHRRWRITANLTPASRRQDHTTLPSASAQFVKRAARVHRIPPRVRDDREPPLWGTGRRGIYC
jgi:hypothetical protein